MLVAAEVAAGVTLADRRDAVCLPSNRSNATTSQLPAITPDVDRAFSARHANDFPSGGRLV